MKTRWIPENFTQELLPEDAPNIVVYLYENRKGKPCAVAYRDKKSKPLFNYAYGNEKARLNHLNQERKWWARDWEQRQAYQAKKAAPSELQPGDIVYVTWGYDQTNVDFYEVLSLTKTRKSARIRQLETATKESSPLAMSGYATPVLGKYEGKVETRRTVGKDGVHTDVSAYGGAAKRWNGQPVACSWDF